MSLFIITFWMFFSLLTYSSAAEEHDNAHNSHGVGNNANGHDMSHEEGTKVDNTQAVIADDSKKPHEHVHMNMDMKQEPEEENLFKSVGLDEKLGEKIPLDLPFVDEKGKKVTLGDLVDRPVLLQLVFYHCPQSCNMMMADLASAMASVTFAPGEDFRIVTVSFDHEDTPQIASDTKSNYMNIVPDDFPKDQWYYLTGNIPEIHALTSAAGFRFIRLEQHNFIHPNVLIVLGEDGTIIRYLYGLEYLPFDVSMAITEAAKGTPAISIKKLLTYCFDYDPEGKKYVFKTFRVTGVALILVLGAFFMFLLKKGNQKPKSTRKEESRTGKS